MLDLPRFAVPFIGFETSVEFSFLIYNSGLEDIITNSLNLSIDE